MKISMIGAGRVGSTTLYTLLLEGGVTEMVIVDVDKPRAKGEALDLRHALALTQNLQDIRGRLRCHRRLRHGHHHGGHSPKAPAIPVWNSSRTNTELMGGILDGVLKYNNAIATCSWSPTPWTSSPGRRSRPPGSHQQGIRPRNGAGHQPLPRPPWRAARNLRRPGRGLYAGRARRQHGPGHLQRDHRGDAGSWFHGLQSRDDGAS